MPFHTPAEIRRNAAAPTRQTRLNVLPGPPSVLETGFEVPEIQMKQNLPPRVPGFSSIDQAIL